MMLGTQKTSGSNVYDAPPSEKGDSEYCVLLLVWEPTTGAQQRVRVPVVYDVIRRYEEVTVYATAAVFCAADGGCDHRDCFRGPFGVLLVLCVEHDGDGDGGRVTLTRLYSSETDSWDELRWIFHGLPMCFTFCSSVLVGRSLLYFMSDDGCILEYDFARHDLTVFDPPNYESIYDGRYNIMLAEDGGLGVTQEMSPHLRLWTREVIEGADARWVLSRVTYLQNLLPDGALVEPASSLYVLGFAEGANVIFMTTVAGLFTIELESERVSRVCDDHVFCNLIPIVSFYTPVPRGEQKDPSFEPSEDAGGQEGGGDEEEETVGQAHQLLDNGSNIIKEGGFVGAFDYISHDLENRLGCSSQKLLAPPKQITYN
ncbi:uncharacterized protein LOC119283944 [Triticum dicoccoides]|uniref:uncharacterized protein LOC119283944 n=1 Tax=Triticum dicoccoides TaxID=85692 RepID=UPI00188FBD53|nr:uncharacterized protein LOC119283944 [Triticum dicoccoides]